MLRLLSYLRIQKAEKEKEWEEGEKTWHLFETLANWKIEEKMTVQIISLFQKVLQVFRFDSIR